MLPALARLQAVSAVPDGLAWSGWERLSQWPGFWHKKLTKNKQEEL